MKKRKEKQLVELTKEDLCDLAFGFVMGFIFSLIFTWANAV